MNKIIKCPMCKSKNCDPNLHTLEFDDSMPDNVACWFWCGDCDYEFLVVFEPNQNFKITT